MSDAAKDQQHAMLLGEMKGMLEGIKTEQARQAGMLTTIDARLRDEEKAGVKASVITSSIIGIGMALIIEQVKTAFRSGGSGS